ncbi:MAG: hypothetical protein AAF456_15175 [Planctomycetota bacterium]
MTLPLEIPFAPVHSRLADEEVRIVQDDEADRVAERSGPTPEDRGVVYLGDRRELFVDRSLIESMAGASLVLATPRPCGHAIEFDSPWEGAFSGYATVIKSGDQYLMYYRGLPVAGKDGTDTEVTCVAISQDGISWNKPVLGLYEFDGSLENNIILAQQAPCSHNFAPFLDSRKEVPTGSRFKALAGSERSGLIAFESPDGIEWSRLQQAPVFVDGVFDSQNVSFWSEAEQKYICYFRTWTGGGYSGFRTVSRSTSPDFLNWSAPQEMSFGDTPVEHLYTNQTSPYFRAPHVYIGLAARFQPGRRVITDADAEAIEVAGSYSGDCSDTVLLTTRGGTSYEREFMESFVRPGIGDENWVSRANYAANGVVPTGDTEMSIYVARNYGQPSAFMERFSLRTDGFASLHAGYEGGEVTTRPLDFSVSDSGRQRSRRLVINASTSAAGSIRIELQNTDGNPLDGFALSDCAEIVGDKIRHVVTWKPDSDVADLEAQRVRLRIVLRDADVYSFRFE